MDRSSPSDLFSPDYFRALSLDFRKIANIPSELIDSDWSHGRAKISPSSDVKCTFTVFLVKTDVGRNVIGRCVFLKYNPTLSEIVLCVRCNSRFIARISNKFLPDIPTIFFFYDLGKSCLFLSLFFPFFFFKKRSRISTPLHVSASQSRFLDSFKDIQAGEITFAIKFSSYLDIVKYFTRF